MRQAEYTTPLSVSSQFMFCGLPLRLDTYRGCAFQCSFCFARQRGGNSPDQKVVAANPERIARVFDLAFTANESDLSFVGQFLRRRVPIHFGGMSDPFQPVELRYGVTRATLNILAKHNYPTVISTRGSMVSSLPYIRLLKRIGPVLVQFSFSSSIDSIARKFEPKASPPSELLKSMETLSRQGIGVSCRWQPFIPGHSEAPADFVSRVSDTGCSHVSIEHLKLPLERKGMLWQQMVQATGYDPYERYLSVGGTRDGREMVLPPEHKLRTVLETAREVRRCGMRFGAADNEFQYLSDYSCCCSGADGRPGFENFFKHQIGFAIRQCRGQSITYASIEREWVPEGSVDRFLNSKSRIASQSGTEGTIRDHVKRRWNDPSSPNSPSTFFGVKSTGRAVNGMTLYEWDNDRLALLDTR